MDFCTKKLRQLRRGALRNSISLIFLFILIFCLLYLLNINLPEVPLSNNAERSETLLALSKNLDEARIDELGHMMINMLPDDLAFTIFVPSEEAFEHILQLKASDSLSKRKINDTLAIISRVMGFSTVAKKIPSGAVPLGKELSFDSISGYRLYIQKDHDGALVVNGIRSEYVDIRKAEIIVHKISSVIMDAEFERSFSSDDED